MPQRSAAEDTADGGHESDGVDGNNRTKAQASSKGKIAADHKSSKKRAAPVGANTSKAAKKKKTSASARQVRNERNTAGANVAHGLPTNTAAIQKI